MTVPGRAVQTDLEVLLPAGVDELAHHISLAATKRAARHRVSRGLRGPQAETVVVLGGEDHRLEARVPRDTRPLPGVEPGRVEDGRTLGAISPFPVGEGVDAEMDEHRQFIALPRELGRCGYRPGRLEHEMPESARERSADAKLQEIASGNRHFRVGVREGRGGVEIAGKTNTSVRLFSTLLRELQR